MSPNTVNLTRTRRGYLQVSCPSVWRPTGISSTINSGRRLFRGGDGARPHSLVPGSRPITPPAYHPAHAPQRPLRRLSSHHRPSALLSSRSKWVRVQRRRGGVRGGETVLLPSAVMSANFAKLLAGHKTSLHDPLEAAAVIIGSGGSGGGGCVAGQGVAGVARYDTYGRWNESRRIEK
ncbi:hypothetical protein E2C01_082117 [Portunus trituberculatus]|uniref:Uncharacterized protein n=1 Tax=Portunus trituberculatus TaxID=210409 RepID=A0A5B7IRI8_PORTR|nr:hypothetical protein [Portunus trituberculatus]